MSIITAITTVTVTNTTIKPYLVPSLLWELFPQGPNASGYLEFSDLCLSSLIPLFQNSPVLEPILLGPSFLGDSYQ